MQRETHNRYMQFRFPKKRRLISVPRGKNGRSRLGHVLPFGSMMLASRPTLETLTSQGHSTVLRTDNMHSCCLLLQEIDQNSEVGLAASVQSLCIMRKSVLLGKSVWTMSGAS